MDFAYSPKVQELRERVTAFMDTYVYPAEAVFERQVAEGDRWQPTAIMEELKLKAKAEGLWNLFLPESELGAEQLNGSGPSNERPMISANGAYSRLVRPAPSSDSGRNRFHRPSALAFSLSSSMIAVGCQRSPSATWRSNTASAG